MEKNSKIIVTGVKGQLGYECVRELKERGFINVLGIDIEDLDITNEQAVHEFFKKHQPKVVMHNAGWTAVDKAEFAKLQSMATSLISAYDEYYMTHGITTHKFEDLTLTMPDDFIKTYTSGDIDCVQNSNMFCCMSQSKSQTKALINCGKNDLSVIYVENLYKANNEMTTRNHMCYALPDNPRANRLCAEVPCIRQDRASVPRCVFFHGQAAAFSSPRIWLFGWIIALIPHALGKT